MDNTISTISLGNRVIHEQVYKFISQSYYERRLIIIAQDTSFIWASLRGCCLNASTPCKQTGKAELHILDFKTTQSDFQKPVRPLSCKAKLSYIHTIKTSPSQSRSEAVVCVSTPRMYPRSVYFLVYIIFELSMSKNI